MILKVSFFLQVVSLVYCSLCQDDIYKNCARRVIRGDCEPGMGTDQYGTIHMMLSECRKSCRDYYKDKSYPPHSIIPQYGGLEDHVVDVFGFKMPICSVNGGFTSEGRRILLNLMAMNKEQPNWVPAFTETGFEKVDIPEKVFKALKSEQERLKPSMIQESCAKGVINCEEIIDNADLKESSLRTLKKTFLMNPSTKVQNMMREELLPLAEEWSGVTLEHTSTYGIRRYTNGSWLTSHVDKFNTHVISAILNIDQKVSEDWPLYIKDNNGEDHAVFIKPGQMLWYESARLVHGRPKPLNGEYFDNIFIHYKPVGDWYDSAFIVGHKIRSKPITLKSLKKKK